MINSDSMKVYFVRHGESNYNTINMCGGLPGEYVHLTKKGKEQAKKAAEKLKDKKIDLIITSEMHRTKQTANIINEYHNSNVETSSKINERKFGIYEKAPISEFRNFTKKDKLRAKPKNGESFLELKERVLDFLNDLKKRKLETVLVVAHDQVLRIVYGYFNDLTDEETYKVKVKNCQIMEFVI